MKNRIRKWFKRNLAYKESYEVLYPEQFSQHREYGKSFMQYQMARQMALAGANIVMAHPEGNVVVMSQKNYEKLFKLANK